MSAERLAAERMALATDPLVRLQMAGINPEVGVGLNFEPQTYTLNPILSSFDTRFHQTKILLLHAMLIFLFPYL